MPNEDIGGNVQELTQSRQDYSDQHANAVVKLGNGCTGTLVGASLVVTAGHCSGSGLPHHSRIRTGDWMDLRPTMPIFFGNDSQNSIDSATATQFNYAGFDDIVMLKLDNAIPPATALPARVLTRIPVGEEPVDFLRDKRFQMVGWGLSADGSSPRFRQRANATFGAFPHRSSGVVQPNMFLVRGERGATVMPGDSGSPLFYSCYDPAFARFPFLIGVAQGSESGGGRYLASFAEGGTDSNGIRKPSLRAWFDRLLFHEILPRGVVPLVSWWNQDLVDNFATTKPSWSNWLPSSIIWRSGCRHIHNVTKADGNRVYQKGDYQLYRMEGYVFDPKQPQPPNTVPLFSLWNQEWGDNRNTSHPDHIMNPADVEWNGEEIRNGRTIRGYRMYRLEGYVFDPSQPQPPDTIPIFEWWNGRERDHFLTSDPEWLVPLSEVDLTSHEQGIPNRNRLRRGNYLPTRLAGYVYPPLVY